MIMKENYDRRMREEIENSRGEKKSLLLHACCAPCTAGCIERLLPHFAVTLYFYNPNISSRTEYDKRAAELTRFAQALNVPCIIEEYNENDFLGEIKGLEEEPERGKRCHVCYRIRLKKTAEYARSGGYGYFATTLTLSPLKDAAVLNETGIALEKEVGVRYLCSDFKKGDGVLRSKELCEKYGLYRQNFCGCAFSKKEA